MTNAQAYGIAVILIALAIGLVSMRDQLKMLRGEPQPAAPDGKVELTVDFSVYAPDKKFKVDWRRGDTVLSAMEQAIEYELLEVELDGAGEMAFLKSIDEVFNQGELGENWVFWVNGRISKRGLGAVKTKPDDRILWRFGTFDAADFESQDPELEPERDDGDDPKLTDPTSELPLSRFQAPAPSSPILHGDLHCLPRGEVCRV